ncbi:MAG: hypothetical protein U5S82_14650 [Gammaproteobacteria bacterium]|nr:hypothetical protein [Gammaproteobacteria bacterium]
MPRAARLSCCGRLLRQRHGGGDPSYRRGGPQPCGPAGPDRHHGGGRRRPGRGVRRLPLAQGGDPDAQNARGRTALMAAAANGHAATATLLVERGADVELADQGGDTATTLARARRSRRSGPGSRRGRSRAGMSVAG